MQFLFESEDVVVVNMPLKSSLSSTDKASSRRETSSSREILGRLTPSGEDWGVADEW
jgi:hypothetical protein